MAAGDTGEFVDRVCDGLHAALMDLDYLLDALEDDGRVGPERRRALAAQLAYLAYEHMETWQWDLTEDLGPEEG